MTIICVRDGIMAVDSLAGAEGCRTGYVKKWVEVPAKHGGGFAAFTGDAGRCAAARDLLPKRGPKMVLTSGDVWVVWLKADGQVVQMDASGVCYASGAPFFAQGGPWHFALGAMAGGASAEDAARLCCEYYPGVCGGEITVLRIGKNATSKRRS